MFSFHVYVNGKRLCRAGVGDAGVLDTIVSWVGGVTGSVRTDGHTKDGEARIHVGGLYHPTPEETMHVTWHHHRLCVGDRVTIRLVESKVIDPPHRTSPGNPRQSSTAPSTASRRVTASKQNAKRTRPRSGA